MGPPRLEGDSQDTSGVLQIDYAEEGEMNLLGVNEVGVQGFWMVERGRLVGTWGVERRG